MKIVVCGNYGAGNLGDELILEGMLETLKISAPGAEITAMSGNPAETEKIYGPKYGIKSVEMLPAGLHSFVKSIFSPSRTKKVISECDYFILGGGGLFNDLNWQADLIWTTQVREAFKKNKPVIMYGQSVGPLGDLSKFLVRRIFSKAAFIGVRDEDSSTELKKLGITKEIVVTPDLAFRLPVDVNQASATPPIIIISLRQIESLNEKFIKEFAAFCNWLIEEKKYNLKFIDFQSGPEGDDNLHENIIVHIKHRDKITHIHPTINADKLLEHFQKADFVFAMRMHAVICAMKTNKPFLAISYSRKIDSLIKDSNLENYLIGHDHIYFDQLKDFFILMNEKKEDIKEKLQKLNSLNLEKLQASELKLKNLLK